MRGPLIQAALPSDRPRIARLQTASWAVAYASVLPANYLASGLHEDLEHHWAKQSFGPRDVILVAERGAQLEGFIAVWDQSPPLIDNLHVHPDCRSGGLGTNLMRAAAKALTELGHCRATLWVVSDNHRAIRFYQRLGGQIAETGTKDLFGTPAPVTRINWSDLSVLLPD